MHSIHQNVDPCSPDYVQVHHTGHLRHVLRRRIELPHQLSRHRLLQTHTSRLNGLSVSDVLLQLRHNLRRRTPPVLGLELHSVPLWRIVARRNHHRPRRTQLRHAVAHHRRRTYRSTQQRRYPVRRQRLRGATGKVPRPEPRVEPHHNASVRPPQLLNVARHPLNTQRHVLESKLLRNDRPPAVRPKLYRHHQPPSHQNSQSAHRILSFPLCSLPPLPVLGEGWGEGPLLTSSP